jgi:hypothetical protein
MRMMTIRNVLHALGQEVDTMVEYGTGEVSWTDLEKFSGQAIDAVNYLDEAVGDLAVAFASYKDFFRDLQASEAWLHFSPDQRRRAIEVMGDMDDMYHFFLRGEK